MLGLKLPKKNDLKRYRTLCGILGKFGFGDVISHSSAMKLIPKGYLKKHPDTEKLLALSTFERIRMVLEELGPTYVKMGQMVSTREDVLPPELIHELEKLQDHVPFLKNFEVEKAVTEGLAVALADHFSSIAPNPLAAASLA